MMTNTDEDFIKRSIWIGPEYASIGDVRVRGKQIEFRKLGGAPFMNKFIPVLTNGRIPYQDRKLLIPGMGDSQQSVRIFFSDLYGQEYYAKANPQELALIASLRKRIEILEHENEWLNGQLKSLSGEDFRLKSIKKDITFYNEVKGYGSGGFGGGFNNFGGGYNDMGNMENSM